MQCGEEKEGKDEKIEENFLNGLALTSISTCDPSNNVPKSPWISNDEAKNSLKPHYLHRINQRAVLKNGDCNVIHHRSPKHRFRFLQDIFTTLVDTQWRWTLTIFTLVFAISWLAFALIWWLIAFSHGDLEPDHLPPKQAENHWIPCVFNIDGFTSCFLYSVETQTTTGFGYKATTEECPEAILLLCLQSIAGMTIEVFMVGIVFAKMTRPKLRNQTLLFSKNCVVCLRDGRLCLMFRIGDMRKSHIIDVTVKAQLIQSKTTEEGEVLSIYHRELSVQADSCEGNLILIWPMTIVHVIGENSPLFHVSAEDLIKESFEIIVVLEGTVESTGLTTQARSSYLAREIMWGRRFQPIILYNNDKRRYEVDYSKFNNTQPVDTPLGSGAQLQEFFKTKNVQVLESTVEGGLIEEPMEVVVV